MSKLYVILTLILLQLSVVNAQKGNDFSIVKGEESCTIAIDKNDAKVVEIAAKMLAGDIANSTGRKIEISKNLSSNMIIAGSIGKNKLIDGLIATNKIEVAALKNKWETFSIQVVKNPFKGVKQALVIVGSDRRGTAYGLLEISRMMGISPWEWWADVTPHQQKEIVLAVENKVYKSPAVKYRGVFLNDEDWGLQRWAALNFEPETGDIGPKTYAKVFELLLRLRANTIWPAMHSSTKPFYSYPQNKQVADDYAIVIGTSHAEPMLSNINTEWNHKTMGEYRYDTNAEVIKGLFSKRTKRQPNLKTFILQECVGNMIPQ